MDCYEELKKNIIGKKINYEIIFVDDGSEDDSWEICKEIAIKDKNIRLLKLSRNFGSHAACYAGLVVCTGDCATIKTADCQEPSSLIIDMYESWKKGNRVVLATRTSRDESFFQTILANVYYSLVRKFFSKKMPKAGFDCYLIDRKVIEALKLLDERNSAITLQILWAGFKTSIVFYKRMARKKGKSRWTLSKKVKLFMDSFVNFSSAPVRFVELIGVLFATGSFIWGIVLILLKLTGHIPVTGWTALMIVILFSSGTIMLSLGILGEYIWRTLDVAQNRPVYFVEEEINNKNIALEENTK
jgi:dolichol-phosphate mannosyltransferase